MFAVIEIQDNGSNVSTLSYQFETYEDASAKYHTILTYAAKSEIKHHGAVIITRGRVMHSDAFDHVTEEILDVV